MGAPLIEYTLEATIRDGLGELRSNPAVLDDIFSKFLAAFQATQYGQSKIDELKTYITNNQIRIVQAHSLAPMSVPCISIQLNTANETEADQTLGNEYLEFETPKVPTVYVPVVTPGTYDSSTGRLTVVNAADLSLVCPGWVFVDADDNKFTIGAGNSNLSGNKYINIGKNLDVLPNLLADGRIESPIDFTRTDRGIVRYRETISIGCWAANDIHLVKFLHVILTYILKSRQDVLIARGLQLDKGDASIHDRMDEYKGEHIFSRMTTVSGLTEFSWNKGEVAIMDCFDLTINIPTPDPDSEDVIPLVTTSPDS